MNASKEVTRVTGEALAREINLVAEYAGVASNVEFFVEEDDGTCCTIQVPALGLSRRVHTRRGMANIRLLPDKTSLGQVCSALDAAHPDKVPAETPGSLNLNYAELELSGFGRARLAMQIVSDLLRQARNDRAGRAVSTQTGRFEASIPWWHKHLRDTTEVEREEADRAARDADQWRHRDRAPRRRFGI